MMNMVTELVALFQGQEFEIVQKVVKEATNQVWPEIVTGPLSDLFDNQMETLRARGYPQNIIEVFVKKKSEVIAKVMKNETTDGHIPFIPVIPRTEIDLDNLMKMVRNRDYEGYNRLNQSCINNNFVDVPKGPYFIFNVEDGKDMLNKSPEEAEALIKKQKRTCLIADEGIALCIHTNVLGEHYVNCTGSRCRRVDIVPGVCLSDDWPKLN